MPFLSSALAGAMVLAICCIAAASPATSPATTAKEVLSFSEWTEAFRGGRALYESAEEEVG